WAAGSWQHPTPAAVRSDSPAARSVTVSDPVLTRAWPGGDEPMIDPSEITTARSVLGRLLAKYREAAGLYQHPLAPHTHYCRSTHANVETGRQNMPRAFWERCEHALDAGGALLAAAGQLEDLVQRHREETTKLADIQREREQHQPGLHQLAELAAAPEQVGV